MLSPRFCFLLLFLSLGHNGIAAPQDVPAPPPASETPDYAAATWEPASSMNFKASTRPSLDLPVDRIVMHDIEGSALSAIRWFQNPASQVSSHYVVDAVTGQVYQMVKERDIAWHAGNRDINTRAIGIEQEGFAYRPGFYTPVVYEASARLVRDIALRHGIPRDREHIIGHFEVPDRANPGKFGGAGGHTDPGPYYDWDYFMTLVRNDSRNRDPSGLRASKSLRVLHPGESSTETIWFYNFGDDIWLSDRKDAEVTDRRKQGTVFLGDQGTMIFEKQDGQYHEASDAARKGFYKSDWFSPRYAATAAEGDIIPGGYGSFTVPLHAPTDFYGYVRQDFRLVKVPGAPGVPVPFGEAVNVTALIVPWDIIVPPPVAVIAPAGWSAKPTPDGSRMYWRKTGRGSSPMHWERNVPMSGSYDVYVRLMANSNRTARAEYHVNGKTVYVDQRGSGWHKLGRYALQIPPSDLVYSAPDSKGSAMDVNVDPLPSLHVILSGNSTAPGIVVGGDLRLVGPFPAKP